MKKKTIFQKTAAALVITLSLLPVLSGTLPPACDGPDTTGRGENVEGEPEPGIQPLDDRDPKEEKKYNRICGILILYPLSEIGRAHV